MPQVALVVTNKNKMHKPRDPNGVVTTYGEYQKTTIPKSDFQGLARNQADKFL